METLPYGLKRPQNGDKGQRLTDALNENITQLDGHTHDGVNSPTISTAAIDKITQPIPNANWSNPVNGVYSQVIVMTGGLQFDKTTISFRDTDTGKSMSLQFQKVDATSYRVYCNDNTKNVTALYV